MNGFSILLDAIARPRCIECDAPRSTGSGPLCSPCSRELPWWRAVDGCPRCGSQPCVSPTIGHDAHRDASQGCSGCLVEGSALHVCRSLVRYQGSIRRWIPGFKSAKSPFGPSIAIRLAIDHLATELASRVGKETKQRPDLIVSIPVHRRRIRQRGFNHVDPIARRIARVLDRPWAPNALERRHDTQSQAKLVGRERHENVRGAFSATDHLGGAKSIWLVDDVLTTGNTLDSAADALLEAGAVEVRALTLAATLPARWASTGRSAYHPAAAIGRPQGSK
jgi:ComF family protein